MIIKLIGLNGNRADPTLFELEVAVVASLGQWDRRVDLIALSNIQPVIPELNYYTLKRRQ